MPICKDFRYNVANVRGLIQIGDTGVKSSVQFRYNLSVVEDKIR